MNSHCTILLLFAAVAGVSAASNLNENIQLVDRSNAPPPDVIILARHTPVSFSNLLSMDKAWDNGYCTQLQKRNFSDLSDRARKSIPTLPKMPEKLRLKKMLVRSVHHPATNQLIAKLPHGGKTVLTTGQIHWGYKRHNLFFRVMFYNALQYVQIKEDKVLVILERPYGEPQVLKTLQRPQFQNHIVSNEFCVELPKTGNPTFAISFKIVCASTKCAKAVDYVDITQISLMGVTIQETPTGCSH